MNPDAMGRRAPGVRPSVVEIWCLTSASGAGDAGVLRQQAHRALRRALVRHVGPQRAGEPFAIGSHGKPRLAADPGEPVPAFSLAHAEGAAVVAIVCGGGVRAPTVGVDIERYRPVQMRDDRRRLLEAVGAALAPERPMPGEPQARFFAAWTRIEAAAKATGEGVARLLEAVGGRHLGAVGDEEIARRAASLLAREGIAVHDLAVGPDLAFEPGLAAAIALPIGLEPSPIADGRVLLAAGT